MLRLVALRHCVSTGMVRHVTTIIAAALLALGPTTASAAKRSVCEEYALASLKQQQRNRNLHCGYKGPGWTFQASVHKGFCTNNPPDVWLGLERKRKKLLDKCAMPPG